MPLRKKRRAAKKNQHQPSQQKELSPLTLQDKIAPSEEERAQKKESPAPKIAEEKKDDKIPIIPKLPGEPIQSSRPLALAEPEERDEGLEAVLKQLSRMSPRPESKEVEEQKAVYERASHSYASGYYRPNPTVKPEEGIRPRWEKQPADYQRQSPPGEEPRPSQKSELPEPVDSAKKMVKKLSEYIK